MQQITGGIKHIRQVTWLRKIPRSAIDQDILYSLGAHMTVFRIEKNDAENRIKALLNKPEASYADVKPDVSEYSSEEYYNIEEQAKDQIVKYIERKFKGHGLARLVEAILRAQGYETKLSTEGPDGGVDILAASGPLGFDGPRICVQVKSSSSPVGDNVLRELQGVMYRVKAEHGLLVAWGGFNLSERTERDVFFSVRLWDQGDLIEQILKYYEKFDDELKAELRLKRIWSLVIKELDQE